MNIGDRVKFRTVGGWYNSGIIRDINKKAYDYYFTKQEEYNCLNK